MFGKKKKNKNTSEVIFHDTATAERFIHENSCPDMPYVLSCDNKRAYIWNDFFLRDGTLVKEGMIVYDKYNNSYLVEKISQKGTGKDVSYRLEIVSLEDEEDRHCHAGDFYSEKNTLRHIGASIQTFFLNLSVSLLLYGIILFLFVTSPNIAFLFYSPTSFVIYCGSLAFAVICTYINLFRAIRYKESPALAKMEYNIL